MKIRDLNITEWNEQMESDFKVKVAEAATAYCYPDRCGLTQLSSRRKRSSDKIEFASDMVNILPGYPKKSTDNSSITLLAFYLQLPQGFSDDVVDKDVLKAIVESKVQSIEGSLGGTIVSIQPLIVTTETTEKGDKESKPQNAVIIGASVGVAILVVVMIALLFRFKRRKRLIAAKKKASNGFNNNAYINSAYCIGSGEQELEMKRGDQAFSSGNVPDPLEHYYAAVNGPHSSSNHSTVTLQFPDSIAEKNSEDVAPPIYQTLESGVNAPIYQALGVDAPIYQALNNNQKSP